MGPRVQEWGGTKWKPRNRRYPKEKKRHKSSKERTMLSRESKGSLSDHGMSYKVRGKRAQVPYVPGTSTVRYC